MQSLEGSKNKTEELILSNSLAPADDGAKPKGRNNGYQRPNGQDFK